MALYPRPSSVVRGLDLSSRRVLQVLATIQTFSLTVAVQWAVQGGNTMTAEWSVRRPMRTDLCWSPLKAPFQWVLAGARRVGANTCIGFLNNSRQCCVMCALYRAGCNCK